MVLRVEGSGPNPEEQDFDSTKERVELSEENQEEFEFIIRSIQEVLHTEHKANEGNNGVIFKVRVKEQEGGQEIKEYAAKLLKVGDFADLENEYKNQRQAYEIIQQAIAEGRNPDELAKVPLTDFCKIIDADEAMKKHLENEGVKVSGGDVGVMVMDWVYGEDIATHLFKEVLRRKESHYLETIKQNDFNQLLAAVGFELGYVQAGGKATRAGDKNFERIKVEQENEDKVYRFLKNKRYTFPKKTVEQITNTIDLLEQNGVVMWDSHARNVMVDGQGENPHLIDFAPQKQVIGEDARTLDARGLVRNLEGLTTTPEEDRQLASEKELKDFEKEYLRRIGNEQWVKSFVEKYPGEESFLKELDFQMRSGVDNFDSYLFALLYKVQTEEITKESAVSFLQANKSENLLPWKSKLVDLAIKKAGG